MRRKAGLAGVKAKQAKAEKAKEFGNALQENQLADMKNQLEEFKVHLEEFAFKHKKEINDNPVFRKQFLSMCREIGVDPLSCKYKITFCFFIFVHLFIATQKTGIMSKLFDKGINDFYYELAIQITNICIALRPKNGGFMEEKECLRLLNKLRGNKA